MGDLRSLADGIEQPTAVLQAARSSGASLLLSLPRDHFLWQAAAFCEQVHDSSLNLCPEPSSDHIIIIMCSVRLPSWPCRDVTLAALEARGTTPSDSQSRLTESFSFLGSAVISSARQQPPDTLRWGQERQRSRLGITRAQTDPAFGPPDHKWRAWAAKRDLPKRVFAHIAQESTGALCLRRSKSNFSLDSALTSAGMQPTCSS